MIGANILSGDYKDQNKNFKVQKGHFQTSIHYAPALFSTNQNNPDIPVI